MDFDLNALPVIDKHHLIGACVRLPPRLDGVRLAAEVNALPKELWGSRGGRGGVHDRADAIFLRGYAPAEGSKPLEDRPPLALLPTVRKLIEQVIPASPMRCVLARLAPKANIPSHADAGLYLDRTIRLHVAVITNPHVKMFVEDKVYRMDPGEIWALNNSGTHGVLNDDPRHARTHLICDFLPSQALIQLISAGDPDLGVEDPEVLRRFEELYLAGPAAAHTR